MDFFFLVLFLLFWTWRNMKVKMKQQNTQSQKNTGAHSKIKNEIINWKWILVDTRNNWLTPFENRIYKWINTFSYNFYNLYIYCDHSLTVFFKDEEEEGHIMNRSEEMKQKIKKSPANKKLDTFFFLFFFLKNREKGFCFSGFERACVCLCVMLKTIQEYRQLL